MAKKKAIKLAAASAVAASAFVAAAPAQTDAASNVAVEVSKAVTQMKKAYHTYSDVTAQGKFAPIADVYKEYNAAKKAYANAKAVVTKAGGSAKEAYLAQLDATYNEYIAKRVVTYIDAFNYATALEDKKEALEAALEDKNWDKAEELYHEISYELNTRTVILHRVYGQTARNLLVDTFKVEAQDTRDSITNEVSVKMYYDKAADLVAEGKLEEAKKAMDHVADYVAKLDKDTDFGAALLTQVSEVKAAYEAKLAPAVESVSAINAKEIVVKFNKAVSKASVATTDFAVTATGTTTANVVTDVKVSEDGKSALLLLTSAVPTAGVDVKVSEGAILTGSFDKFPEFTTTAVKVADTKAPKLLSVVATDSTTVELTFDEQVDWTTNLGGISVNGGTLINGVNSTKAGDYTYTFTVPTLKSGANTVQALNYADFSGNKEALTTSSVNYSADVSTPAVASIKAEDSNSFVLTFNKVIDTIANTDLTVKKGNYTFTSTDLALTYVDADGNLTASAGTTPSKYVKVTVPTQASSANPLYATNENSVSLSVAVSGYKDGTVIGKEYTGSVTLSKDLTAPAVVSSKLITFDKTADTITVPFDKTLASVADPTKLTVVKGTVKVAATAAVSGKNLVITITDTAGLTDGKYSLVLDKGLVKDGSNNVNESISLTTDVTSATATTQLTGAIFGTSSTFDSGKNVITVNYGTKVDDAAASIASYSLNGSALPSGSVAYFTSSAKDTVKIELPASYTVALNNVNAKISLNANAVKEYSTGNVISSSATEAKAIDQVIALNDNVAPAVSKVEYVKDANGLAVGLKLTFSEAVDTSSTTADFTDDFVVKTGSTVIPYTVAAPSSTDTATDNVVILNFTSVSTAANGVTVATNVDTTKIDLADLSGNNKLTGFSVSAQ